MTNLKRKPPKPKTKRRGLSINMDTFAKILAEDTNITAAEAYEKAYQNFDGKRKTAIECASRLLADDRVRKRVEEYRDAIIARCPLTLGEALGILAEVARNKEEETGKRIMAIREMQGLIPQWQNNQGKTPPTAIAIQIVNGNKKEMLAKADAEGNVEINVDAEVVDE